MRLFRHTLLLLLLLRLCHHLPWWGIGRAAKFSRGLPCPSPSTFSVWPIRFNGALTLGGIPLETFAYKLGNRSALEWVIDQYQVSTDKRSGIVTDSNRADDQEYIVRLVRRVVTVSVETVRLVSSLPPLTPHL